jgi:hypothetical protein
LCLRRQVDLPSARHKIRAILGHIGNYSVVGFERACVERIMTVLSAAGGAVPSDRLVAH